MASENSDPFDGASPNTIHMQEPDGYDDVLGIRVPIEALDLPMSKLPWEPDQTRPAIDSGSMREISMRNPITGAFAQSKETHANTLPGFAAESSKILVSEHCDTATAKLNSNPAWHEAATKDPPNEVIGVSHAKNNVSVKEEEDEGPFNWTSMPDTISVSDDDDDEILMLQPDGTSVPIKKEDDEVEFIWEKMGARLIELDSDDEPSAASKPNLGKSFLGRSNPKGKRTPIDRERAMRAQELHKERLRRQGKLGPAGNPGNLRHSHAPTPATPGATKEDEFAWMKAGEALDEDAGQTFKELKRGYKIKAKKDSNTIYDDIEYQKAERAENVRRHNLKLEYEEALGAGDTDDSDKDEEGLFVTPPSKRASSTKRRRALSNEGDDTNEVNQFSSRNLKKQKSNRQGKRSQEELDEEKTANMLAGIEIFLAKKKFAGEDQAESSAEQAKGTNAKSSKSSRGKKSGPGKLNRKVSSYQNHFGDLLTSNVFDDATANNDRDALPVSSETNKRKAMKAIVASVPLENKREAKDDEAAILKATVTLASRKVTADGQGGWKLQGMASSLHNHQILAANFMKVRETAGQQPLGGILADGMGLGKTLMTLATIVANPPSRHEKYRCTLIVCPPGLLDQWAKEIRKHLAPGVMTNVLKHHSRERINGDGAVNTLEKSDIVLTTYGEVVKSYPKPEVPAEITTREELLKWWDQHWDENRDTLHKVHFHRVVLDEAQAIKNHVTATSIACRALMAQYKWSLSGTPIMNRVDELYPYFKFLRIPYTGCFADFVENYCIPGSTDCNKRLHCLLDQIMMRRTYKDSLLGAPIVKLPKFNQRTIDLEFNIVEHHIYQLVYRKFVGILNKASAEGKLEKQPGLGLVAFLRLRQLAAHTFLVQEVLKSIFESVKHVNNLEQVTILKVTPENKPERELIAALRRMIVASVKAAKDTPKNPEIFDITAPRLTNLAAQFGKYLQELKANKKWTQLRLRTVCQRCGEPPVDPLVTDCFHVYCEECLLSMAHDAAAKGHDHTACMQCETIYTKSEPCSGLKELEFDDFAILNETKTKNGKVNMEWVSYDDNLVLSTKITAVRTQVDKWLRDEPDKKIIIFSQFHMIMQILEGICQKQGWKYCTYHGKMSHKAREKTISLFGTDPETKIMIASLKCGGTGLNLTMASKVICIDLWFNSCMEQQAFCRVFRIGQTSETWITKFIVQRSADEKLMEMQLKKNALIGAAMDDKEMMSKLTVEEVMRLFGEVRFDKNKKPFIVLGEDEKLDSILN